MSNMDAVLSDTLTLIMEQHDDIDAAKEEIKVMIAGLKGQGYDTAAVRKIITRKKRDRDDVVAADEAVMLYESAMGMKMPSW